MLSRHDWTYAYSDDHGVWTRGHAIRGNLITIAAKGGPEYQKLYNDFEAYVFSSWKKKPDGSPDYEAGKEAPKPERPKTPTFRTGESSGT
jgi:hypothetical protein